MDTRKHMIITGGKFITKDVRICTYNQKTNKYDLQFYTGKTYSYDTQDLLFLQDPQILDAGLHQIFHAGEELSGIDGIYVFQGRDKIYFHLCFGNGNEADYEREQLEITESCFKDASSRNVFAYLKQMAPLSDLKKEDGSKLLERQYAKISFVGENTALASYLKPKDHYAYSAFTTPIYPFGCNGDQYKAVSAALEHSVSIIQGPPGTARMQTILNIIANLLVLGKTVQLVSDNDAAAKNILEKFSSPQYQMGFLVAPLGGVKNKKEFIERQTERYPDLSAWKAEQEDDYFIENIEEKSEKLEGIFERQEGLDLLKQELAKLEQEYQYFKQYAKEKKVDLQDIKIRKHLDTEQYIQLWQEYQSLADKEEKLKFSQKLQGVLLYGIGNLGFYKQDLSVIITVIQDMVYRVKLEELREGVRQKEKELTEYADQSTVDEICDLSMQYLRNTLYRKYGGQKERRRFTETDLWREPYDVLEEYPVVLNTTVLARSSLHSRVVFDYLIMDGASSVDIAVGALALSCAKNVVIVGDTNQPPDAMTSDIVKRANDIMKEFHAPRGYDFIKNNFFQSVLQVMPQAPQILLREPYCSENGQADNGTNVKVKKGKLYSVFDYLYQQYTGSRLEYLKASERIAEYDAENAMYALITEVLQNSRYEKFSVACHIPLYMVIRNYRLLYDNERAYAMNNAAHLDFLIYNNIEKKPVLAIELEDEQDQKEKTLQAAREQRRDSVLEQIKSSVLEQYGISLLHFSESGSEEKEKLIAKLEELL